MGATGFADIKPGMRIVSARRTVTDADVMAFAGVSGDFAPLHTDEVFIAEATAFHGRIAHGLLIVAISSGLRSDIDNWQVLAFLEIQRRFVAPVYPGDTVHATFEVTETRPSKSQPGRGVVRLGIEVANQDHVTVQTGTDVLLVGDSEDAEG